MVFGLGLALYAPYAFLRQMAGRRRVGDWRGRLGRRAWPAAPGAIWVHGVSVGEVAASRLILSALRRRGAVSPLVLSSSTEAGLERARSAPEADLAVPFPFDLAGPVERALSAISPSLVLLTETEIWPLFLAGCAARGIPVALVNGRISQRSFARYRLFGPLMARTLSHVSLFLMQSQADAGRIRALGASPDKVRVTGNVKFDLDPQERPELASRIRFWAAGRLVLLAGSTHDGEELAILEAWRRMNPRPFLVIAPRRPERFDEVAGLAAARGIRLARRSSGGGAADALLLDTVGELAPAYGAADAAFIGGSLAAAGGHNPIEAWAHGVPTLHGPHVSNFREIYEAGMREGASERVETPRSLAHAAAQLLADDVERARRGRQARALVARNRGAAQATAEAVLALRKTA
jgi:3-deoxy-D-manno-octulosonic-acid transferase